jgi:hypothetical protein
LELITIQMDAEDHRNANSAGGWIGATVQNRNTTFKFCRVDGAKFNTASFPYAVLQLSEQCPAPARSFARYFHNESHDNINDFSTSHGNPILPNASFSAAEGANVPSYTYLNFCFFPPLGVLGGQPNVFPDFQTEYGVFAARGAPGTLSSGFLRIDDEDDYNLNRFDFTNWPSELIDTVGTFISGSRNTDLSLVQVKSGPKFGRLNSVKLNTTSVKGGNNGKDPTLTVYLDGPAPPCGQVVYLSTSNNVARITGSGNFTIPGGQTSGAISWFLGTRNVLVNRSVNIIVTVNGQEGYAGLTVRK